MPTNRFLHIAIVCLLVLVLPLIAAGQTAVCPNTQWQLQNPELSPYPLLSIWGISSTSIYAVGYNGVIVHYDGLSWSRMDSPTSKKLSSVWGSSDNNVYAVGDDGTVLRFDGLEWRHLTGSNTYSTFDFRSLHGGGGRVYFLGRHDIFRAGQTSYWRTYETECGILVSSPCEWITSIWVSPSGNYWAAGGGYSHSMYPETQYGFVMGPDSEGFNSTKCYGIWGSSDSDVYVMVNPSWDNVYGLRIFHYNGSGWHEMTLPEQISSIRGSGTTGLFGYTAGGSLYSYRDSIWTTVNIPANTPNGAMWGNTFDDITIIGGCDIAHFDGANFELYGSNSIGAAMLRDVFPLSGDNAYAVGDGDGLFHYDGVNWESVAGISHRLHGIWGSSESNIVAVGDSGSVYRYDGNDWSFMALDADVLTDIGGRSSSDVFAIGKKDGGRVFHYDGLAWSIIGDNIDDKLQCLFLTPEYLFVGSHGIDKGSVWRFDNNNWVKYPGISPFLTGIFSIWGASNDDLWIGSYLNYLIRFDGTTGQILGQITPVNGTLYSALSIWGTSPENIFVAGRYGYIYVYNGSELRADVKIGYENLNCITGNSSCEVFAVGNNGTVAFLDALRDGTVIAINTALNQNNMVRTIIPGEEVCGYFTVIPGRSFIDVDFTISDAVPASGTAQTGFNGDVSYCFTPDHPGAAVLIPSLTEPGVSHSADTLTFNFIPPAINFDTSHYVNGDTVEVEPADEICAFVKLNRNVAGINVDFNISGPNSSIGSAVTDDQGAATYFYPVKGQGTDTIYVTANYYFPGGQYISENSHLLNVIVVGASILVDQEFHSPPDSVYILPGDSVGIHVRLAPAQMDLPLKFSVFGANSDSGTAVTDSAGKAVWNYTPKQVGADTVAISLSAGAQPAYPYHTASLPVYLFHPELIYDSNYQGTIDTVVVCPGDTMCARFQLDPPRLGIPINYRVAGANTFSDSCLTDSLGQLYFCYPVLAYGLDYLTAKTQFDFENESYSISATANVHTLAPSIKFDETFYTATDTLIIEPDSTTCVYLLLSPPLEGVEIQSHITGVNTAEITTKSTEGGRITICYPTRNVGVDTLAVTARLFFGGVYQEMSTRFVYALIYGDVIPLRLDYTAYPDHDASRVLDFILSSNKRLETADASIVYNLTDGNVRHSQNAMQLEPGSAWTYRTSVLS